MGALVYGMQRDKDAVWDSTKWVGLCWRPSEGVKAVEVLVYNSYLEKLLVLNHTQASSWRVLVGTGQNTAMEQVKNEAVCTVREIHLAPCPTDIIVWLKREEHPFVFLTV